jgi:hypothetical protein
MHISSAVGVKICRLFLASDLAVHCVREGGCNNQDEQV